MNCHGMKEKYSEDGQGRKIFISLNELTILKTRIKFL